MAMEQQPHQQNAEEDLDLQIQQLLWACASYDLTKIRELLKTVPASVQDGETGYTPLHAAINACHDNEDIEPAKEVMRLLFENGAIWNDLDANNETPGCLARRLGSTDLYEMMVDAGVRAELLMNRLDGFLPLSDDDDDEEEEEEGGEEVGENPGVIDIDTAAGNTATTASTPTIHLNGTELTGEDASTSNSAYLDSSLSFSADKLIDSSSNGVMMEWESSIMEESAALLLPTPRLSVLNIGHGMGIIDTLIQTKSPSSHHIIEAHPAVLAQMQQTGWRSADDETSTSTKYPNVTVHAGRWQDILPRLVSEGTTFDAIYFDTFAEDYKAFRNFFEEFVIGLLKPQGRWSFFNGLGADRQVCYDVYTKVVEMDLFEAGFDVEWTELPTEEAEREGEWDGVRRRYWALDWYRLPLCKFVAA